MQRQTTSIFNDLTRCARLLVAALSLTAGMAAAVPAQAQIVCRENALGAQICTGVPAPTKLSREPFTRRSGVGTVIPRVQEPGGTVITGAGRTDVLGNTFLTESDLPPGRPSLPGVQRSIDCRRDALGNTVCN